MPTTPNTAVALRDADDQVAQLEEQLIQHCIAALENKRIQALVDGIFSLDDLEQKMENDLNGRIGVGVGYQGSALSPDSPDGSSQDTKRSIMTDLMFVVVVVAPSDVVSTQRYDATELLTVLRKGILGKPVEFSRGAQRHWMFVQEKPEVAASSATMLYYSQVWRLRLPVNAN